MQLLHLQQSRVLAFDHPQKLLQTFEWSRNAREALRMPSMAYADRGKKKAWFFLSRNFNDLRHFIGGTSVCRGTSARLRRGSLAEYTFNTGVAKHLFCRICGIKAFCIPRSNPDGVDVNVRCLDTQALSIKISAFDGQNWEQHAAALAYKSIAS